MAKDKSIVETKKFRVKEDTNVDLGKWPTSIKPVYGSKEEYKSFSPPMSSGSARCSKSSMP